ncbi:MAG: hypothetical protein JXA04_05565 [Gammaproteobacteria bacterium]|nr:hypothetical protein [Gammaproteobacteria bacterium]
MNDRPKSITVICWILIVMAAISLITSTLSMNNPIAREIMEKSPLPINIQYAFMFVGLAVMLISGVVMLKGQNWGRWLYVGWSLFGFVIGITTSPMKVAMIPGLVIFLILVFFLFRPIANKYFKKAEAG